MGKPIDAATAEKARELTAALDASMTLADFCEVVARPDFYTTMYAIEEDGRYPDTSKAWRDAIQTCRDHARPGTAPGGPTGGATPGPPREGAPPGQAGTAPPPGGAARSPGGTPGGTRTWGPDWSIPWLLPLLIGYLVIKAPGPRRD